MRRGKAGGLRGAARASWSSGCAARCELLRRRARPRRGGAASLAREADDELAAFRPAWPGRVRARARRGDRSPGPRALALPHRVRFSRSYGPEAHYARDAVRPDRPVAIEKPAAGGRMIARVDGPGRAGRRRDSRRARAGARRAVGKGVVYAQTLAVDEPSADRRDPFPDPLCGGCLYSHIAYPRQLELKAQVIADAFSGIGRLELPAAVPSPVARGGLPDARPLPRARHRLGFFPREQPRGVRRAATRQLLPATCDTLDRLMAAMRSLGLDAVREIELSENVEASERAVFLDAGAIDEATLARLADRRPDRPRSRGALRQPHVERLAGDRRARLTLRRHVQASSRETVILLRDLARTSRPWCPEGRVLDLYAGVGLFSLARRLRGRRVVARRGRSFAADDLQANAAASRARHDRARVGRDIARARAAQPQFDAVIVDPPRTGMSREALDNALRAARAAGYVSCDVATLARDARRIVDHGYASSASTRSICSRTRRTSKRSLSFGR
jgi:23S rRNA (uracil1939-C5)-methyltransferase